MREMLKRLASLSHDQGAEARDFTTDPALTITIDDDLIRTETVKELVLILTSRT